MLSEAKGMTRHFHFCGIVILIVASSVLYYGWQKWFPWFWGYFVFEYRNDIIGTPFIIPFIYASFVSWWNGPLLVWLVSMLGILPVLVYYHSADMVSLFRNIAFSMLPLTLTGAIALELRWRERQREAMADRERERQSYVSRIFKAQEDERRRLAQELHDSSTQELLAIANRSQTLALSLDSKDDKAKESAERIRDAILGVSEDLHRLSLDLRPSILDNLGLIPALRWLLDRLRQETEISTGLRVEGEKRRIRPDAEVMVFRIVQEALNNIRRHSKATEATVTLTFCSESLRIAVRDNGKGFDLKEVMSSSASQSKLGIVGMIERAKSIGAELDVRSPIGGGTLISIEL